MTDHRQISALQCPYLLIKYYPSYDDFDVVYIPWKKEKKMIKKNWRRIEAQQKTVRLEQRRRGAECMVEHIVINTSMLIVQYGISGITCN